MEGHWGQLFAAAIGAEFAGDEALDTCFDGCVDEFDLALDPRKPDGGHHGVLALEGGDEIGVGCVVGSDRSNAVRRAGGGCGSLAGQDGDIEVGIALEGF